MGSGVWAQDEKLETLTITGNTFSNVTIISRTRTHLSFKHANGFASVKLTTLDATEQTKVGYTPPPPPRTVLDRAKDRAKDYTMDFASWLDDPRVKALEADIRGEVARIIKQNDTTILYSAAAG